MHRSAPRAVLVASAVAVACLGPLASEASATVTPVGAVNFTNVGNVVFTYSFGYTETCTSSALLGTAANPATISFSNATFSGCSTALGGVTYTAVGLPWVFTGTSYASGVTTGNLTGVKINRSDSSGCLVTITGPGGGGGTITATYNNGTKQLRFGTNNLRVNTASSGCNPTIFSVGSPVKVAAGYIANNGLTITIP